eukprot:Skav232847  [mRNA]  locus=scaffold1834:834833:838667:- [translate_table: standard]
MADGAGARPVARPTSDQALPFRRETSRAPEVRVVMLGGITLQCKPSLKPMEAADVPLPTLCSVSNTRPEEILSEEPEPEEPEPMAALPHRSSYLSWTEFDPLAPHVMSPNRCTHEAWGAHMETFTTLIQQNPKAFQRYIRIQRGEEKETMFGWMRNCVEQALPGAPRR